MNKTPGSPRSGAGRRALDGAKGIIRITALVTPTQKAAIAQHGGSVFLRRAIDQQLQREADQARRLDNQGVSHDHTAQRLSADACLAIESEGGACD